MTYLVNATQEQIDKVNEINEATENLDPNYFVYDPLHKKHKLNFDVKFKIEDDNIGNISRIEREKLLSVGKALQTFIDSASINNPQVQYLLIVEGQASRDGMEQMDYNYDLSFRRAKNLKKYWDSNDILFNAGNCEVLISGSGDGRLSGTGLMRESEETANQRFLIHILPKPGQIE
jgi:outer membrane protein OmpA-like peptidoglycan-associated protein